MLRDLACIIANGTVAHVVGRDQVIGRATDMYMYLSGRGARNMTKPGTERTGCGHEGLGYRDH